MGRRAGLAGLLIGIMLALAGCTVGASAVPAARTTHGPGGELRILLGDPITTWDPQRLDVGTDAPDAAFMTRLVYRTLTATPPSGVGISRTVSADLATSTGDRLDGNRVWQFAIRPGVLWQDLTPVTCADVAYGISRNFSTLAGGGSALARELLDIPRDGTGSAYRGPWSGVGQDLFDKAVSCTGSVLTLRFNQPVPDFDEIAALPAFAPFRADQDQRDAPAAQWRVFANGPYMLEGAWHPGTGGRFVRTRGWAPPTDINRLARPTAITMVEGIAPLTAIQRVIDSRGTDSDAVTTAAVPPSMVGSLFEAGLTDRASSTDTLSVDYVQPRLSSGPTADPAVRRALAVAADRVGYATGLGGPQAAVATTSVLPRELLPTGSAAPTGAAADLVAAARAELARSGHPTPVDLRLAYPAGASSTAIGALIDRWAQAGLRVTGVPVAGDRAAFARATDGSDPDHTYDLVLRRTDPLLASADSVLRDLRLADPAAIGTRLEAAASLDAIARSAAQVALDTDLAAAGDYIALAQRRNVTIAGTTVDAHQGDTDLGGWIDLGTASLLR